jgi:hypothetical protein
VTPLADGYCFSHSPAQGAKRAAARRLGGSRHRNKHSDAPLPSTEVRGIDAVRALLSYTAAELLVMDNSIARARALIALASVCVEIFKIGELEQRLATIEAALAAGGEHAKSE